MGNRTLSQILKEEHFSKKGLLIDVSTSVLLGIALTAPEYIEYAPAAIAGSYALLATVVPSVGYAYHTIIRKYKSPKE
jgi:hypothetical protein